MHQPKPMKLPAIAAVFSVLTLVAACDKRDNTATPPMPQSSPGTTAPTTAPPAGGSSSMSPGAPSASSPSSGTSR